VLIADMKKSLEAGERLVFLFSNLGRAERMKDILLEYGIPSHLCRSEDGHDDTALTSEGTVLVGIGFLHDGFYLPASGLRVLTGCDVFDESEVSPAPRRSKSAQRQLFLSDFRDLKPGDYVVHIEHGIGQFQGLSNIQLKDGAREFVLLTYTDDAKLYVPVERLDLIQKYTSVGGAKPALDRLGGRVGSGPRPGSRSRCGIWPGSCCGFTPSARRCRALRSARIRPGSKSSKTLSSLN